LSTKLALVKNEAVAAMVVAVAEVAVAAAEVAAAAATVAVVAADEIATNQIPQGI
jgi:hypothetical protein